jgi:hypothetical protein
MNYAYAAQIFNEFLVVSFFYAARSTDFNRRMKFLNHLMRYSARISTFLHLI